MNLKRKVVKKMEKRTMIEELTLLRKVYEETSGCDGCIRGISSFEDCYVARDSDGELYLFAVRNGSRILKDSYCWSVIVYGKYPRRS